MTTQEFLRGLNIVIKNGMKNIAKAIAKRGIFSSAVLVAIAALVAAVALYKQQYEPLVVPDEPATQQSAPSVPSSPPPPPKIATSVTRDQADWMSKYCREQSAALPPAPFQYIKKDTYEKAKGVPVPPLYVGSRMPKNEKGHRVDSLTCGMDYKFDDEEAYASLGISYKFDINRRREFAQRVKEIYTSNMDPSWEEIILSDEERAGYPDAMAGFPLLFQRENPELGTVEYADMGFAVEYGVRFTVFEKPK